MPGDAFPGVETLRTLLGFAGQAELQVIAFQFVKGPLRLSGQQTLAELEIHGLGRLCRVQLQGRDMLVFDIIMILQAPFVVLDGHPVRPFLPLMQVAPVVSEVATAELLHEEALALDLDARQVVMEKTTVATLAVAKVLNCLNQNHQRTILQIQSPKNRIIERLSKAKANTAPGAHTIAAQVVTVQVVTAQVVTVQVVTVQVVTVQKLDQTAGVSLSEANRLTLQPAALR